MKQKRMLFIAVLGLTGILLSGCKSSSSASSSDIGGKVVKQAVKSAVMHGPASALKK